MLQIYFLNKYKSNLCDERRYYVTNFLNYSKILCKFAIIKI